MKRIRDRTTGKMHREQMYKLKRSKTPRWSLYHLTPLGISLSLRLWSLSLSLILTLFSSTSHFIPSPLRSSNSIVTYGRNSLKCIFVQRINAATVPFFSRKKTAYRSPRNCELSSHVKRWSSAVAPFFFTDTLKRTKPYNSLVNFVVLLKDNSL